MKSILTLTAALALAAPAAFAQQSAGSVTRDGEDLVIEGVTVESPGYLVVTEEIPEDAPGSQPAAIAREPAAVAEVQPGENQTVRIRGDFMPDTRYLILLFQESGAEEGFQWSEGVEDWPVSEEGEHVSTTFDIIVDSGEAESDT